MTRNFLNLKDIIEILVGENKNELKKNYFFRDIMDRTYSSYSHSIQYVSTLSYATSQTKISRLLIQYLM